jgi:hypothetical protein
VFVAVTLAAAATHGCSQPAQESAQPQVDNAVDLARLLYQNYSILTRRGKDPTTISIVAVEPIDLSDPVGIQVRMLDEIDRNPWVIPYVAGSSDQAPHMWLQAHPVARAQVRESEDGREYRDRVFHNLDQYGYLEAWTFQVQVTAVDGRFLEYTSYVFAFPQAPGAPEALVDIIDPVIFGVDKVPAALPMFHNTVGASLSGQWNGCEVGKEVAMGQGTVTHWDRGTCDLGTGSYDCWGMGWCGTDAKAKITCDTSKPECPRMVSSTVQSGSCSSQGGGTTNCWFGDCVRGSEVFDMSSKGDTQPSGQCSIHTNIELMTLGTPVGWEISYTTPDSPLGSATVKFTGTIPSHSIYQVFQQTMCCMRVDAGVPDASTPDTGTMDAGTPDTGTADTGTPDTGTADTGTLDTGTPDTGTLDAGTPDTGTLDAGTPDSYYYPYP